MSYQITKYALGLLLAAMSCNWALAEDITRVWLTHKSNDPNKIVVNWVTDEPGDSVVDFGLSPEYGEKVKVDENVTLHHVEIPLQQRGAVYHYSVATGKSRSADATFKSYPKDTLRVAVVADWQKKPDLSAILKDDVHLLLTAGDNIPRLWRDCGEGVKDCVKPYVKLVETYPGLFRSTPFMPVLGNHDKEIRRRGTKYPKVPTYDVDATAFCRFFELPDEEWKWHFDLPEFDLRFIALDINHRGDFGTTWQTCHPFDGKSQQFLWYEKLMQDSPAFVVTLYNEMNVRVRDEIAEGQWGKLLAKGTCCITGYGYYAERAEVDGVPYFNTALNEKVTKPDPKSVFLKHKASYALLTVQRNGNMVVELKDLDGNVLDRRECQRQNSGVAQGAE